jgi:hypothetical protein
LSAVSRSISDISVTSSKEDSLRAFSAAEAGIEQALYTGSNVGVTTLPNGATFQAPIVSLDIAGTEFVYPNDLLAGETATFWFVSHDSNGNLTCSAGATCYTHQTLNIYWGQAGSETTALSASVYHDSVPGTAIASPNNYSTVRVKRLAYHPSGTGNFLLPDDVGTFPVGGRNFAYRKSLPIIFPNLSCNPSTTGCLLMLKIKLAYNTLPQPVAITVQNNHSLPAQGVIIDSTGKSGDYTRKVSVFQGYSTPPSVFDNAVFSFGGITK